MSLILTNAHAKALMSFRKEETEQAMDTALLCGVKYYSEEGSKIREEIWQKYEEKMAQQPQFFILEDAAMELSSRLGKTFYFPSAGLMGEDKDKLIQSLKREQMLQSHRFEFYTLCKEFIEFLILVEIVYPLY
jgi:dTDP-4-amino-4,6-dideoxygalactose transaminase